MSSMHPNGLARATGRPAVFGEVLFDTFPDGNAVLGGAPFNVAWHLQGFGLQPLFISRVGDDEPGARILETMRDWGMDTRGVQRDKVHPTGKVEVSISDGQPAFTILRDQAYDYMDQEAAAQVMDGAAVAVLYHGSLAARNEMSRAALQYLRARAAFPVFVDINLRPPWWTKPLVDELLSNSRWAKLNDAELKALVDRHSFDQGFDTAANAFRRHHGLELLIVTLGVEGALLVVDDQVIRGKPVVVDQVVDTVGAGDAFSALMLYGLLSGWALPVALQRALEFAAAICEQRGATAADGALYAAHKSRWKGEHATE